MFHTLIYLLPPLIPRFIHRASRSAPSSSSPVAALLYLDLLPTVSPHRHRLYHRLPYTVFYPVLPSSSPELHHNTIAVEQAAAAVVLLATSDCRRFPPSHLCQYLCLTLSFRFATLLPPLQTLDSTSHRAQSAAIPAATSLSMSGATSSFV